MSSQVAEQMAPVALRLKAFAAEKGISQRDIAQAAGLSLGAANAWLKTGFLPRSADERAVKANVRGLLVARGATPAQRRSVFRSALADLIRPAAAGGVGKKGGAAVAAAPCSKPSDEDKQENDEMLAPKTNLTREAKVAFGVVLNPFGGEVTCEAEMHQSAEFAYCRELAWQTTLTGGFAALVGESGSGKTTLVEDLQERLAAQGKAVKVIKPSVMASEDSAIRGKPMRSAVLLSAIGMELDGSQGLGGNIEQVSRKVRSMLEASTTAGHLHVLVIEEAHALPVPTLKHLKRMHEYMRLGRKPMLGILLVGQTELMHKLDPARYDVREVAQRCEVVRLMPLDGDLRAYMSTRCKRSGKALDALFSADAVDALRARLTVRSVAAGARGAASVSSMVYPLAVNNLATACLNRAAELGAPLVDCDIVMGV